MPLRLRSRAAWVVWLAGIIATGILSRVARTGLVLLDKYLGDALYAAMIYVILRLVWLDRTVALYAMALMTVIELFQLTMIPVHMLASQSLLVRICARLLGTQFSFLDLLTYAIGIGSIYLLDRSRAEG